MNQAITMQAPAKVNLALSVGAPCPHTGMHPICSWMVTVDLHDTLELRRLDAGTLSRYAVLWADDAPRPTDVDWSIRNDLAVRAHLALEQHVGRALPVQMTLRKRIPVGSGLGGGSANAAAMLHGCNSLFELGLDTPALAQLAAALGSDVPFMVHGGSATVAGLGDDITVHEDLPDLHLVLVLPDARCATADVYRRFDDLTADPAVLPERVLAVQGATHEPFNDLAPAAFAAAPVIDHLARAIEGLVHRPVHVSGSGSSLFLTCDTALEAGAMATAVAEQFNVPTRALTPTRAPGAEECCSS